MHVMLGVGWGKVWSCLVHKLKKCPRPQRHSAEWATILIECLTASDSIGLVRRILRCFMQ